MRTISFSITPSIDTENRKMLTKKKKYISLPLPHPFQIDANKLNYQKEGRIREEAKES